MKTKSISAKELSSVEANWLPARAGFTGIPESMK
jgi:hypothetical protein